MTIKHIQNFDGLRAFAVIWVLLGHGSYGRVSGGGVNLFFLLSGFLITSVLLNEALSTGKIAFGRFYGRRFLRLYPALIATTLLVAVLWDYLSPPNAWNKLAALTAPLLYISNLVPGRALGPMGHTWSLAVEQHFYLLWPLLLAFFVFRRRLKLLLVLAFMCAFVSMLLRVYAYKFGATHFTLDPYRATPYRVDNVIFGSCAALVRHFWREMFSSIFRSSVIMCVAAVGVLYVATCLDISRHATLGESIFASTTCLALVCSASCVGPKWALSNAVSTWIGERSYGIYLYHLPIFMAFEALRVPHDNFNFIFVSALRFGTTFAIAGLSYRFLERPLLRYQRSGSTLASQRLG